MKRANFSKKRKQQSKKSKITYYFEIFQIHKYLKHQQKVYFLWALLIEYLISLLTNQIN
jgi:hypothetical protein